MSKVLFTTATILTVPSTTTFTYSMAGTPAADTLAGSQSATTLCDKTKAWTVNQWAGYMVYMNTTAITAASGLATGQALQIASNTSDTLTFVSGTAPTNGVSRYVITPTKEVTQRMYYIDFNTNTIHGAGMYPYAAGTAIIGNRMESYSSQDGLKYLWLNRHSQAECYRQLLFY